MGLLYGFLKGTARSSIITLVDSGIWGGYTDDGSMEQACARNLGWPGLLLVRLCKKVGMMESLIENPPIRILGFFKHFFTSRWFKFFAILVTIIILALIVLYIAVMVAWSNPPLTTYGVSLGDLNGDGYLDAFYANGKSEGPVPNTVLINQQGLPGGLVAAFKDTGQRLGKEESSFPILADLDGDGDLDAWVVNIGYQTLYFNDGLGGFSPSGSLFEDDIGGTGLWKVAFGDLDGDGDLDAVGAGCCGAIAYSDEYSGKFFPPFNVVWFNQGGRQAGPVGQFHSDLQMPSLGTTAVALGDLDGDGDQDAFFTNDKYIQSVDGDQGNEPGHPNTVWINPGDGKLADSGQRLGSAHSQNVALGDLDGDGDLDAFVANRGPDKVWLNGSDRQPGYSLTAGSARIGVYKAGIPLRPGWRFRSGRALDPSGWLARRGMVQ